MGLLSYAIHKHSCRSQHISVLTTCTFMFRQVCTIEPLFFKTTSGMHRRPFEGRHLVSNLNRNLFFAVSSLSTIDNRGIQDIFSRKFIYFSRIFFTLLKNNRLQVDIVQVHFQIAGKERSPHKYNVNLKVLLVVFFSSPLFV